jgi:hypothetical protein
MTNTTNLINININNSGNITAVAAGENHVLNSNYNSPAFNAQNASIQNDTTPRNNINFNNNLTNGSDSMSMNREICTNQNCDLNVMANSNSNNNNNHNHNNMHNLRSPGKIIDGVFFFVSLLKKKPIHFIHRLDEW